MAAAVSSSPSSEVPNEIEPRGEGEGRERLWRRLDLLLLGGVLAWALVRFVEVCRGYWAYTVDDAYITLRQARNLVEGYGFVYNPGGPRVESYTNHLLFLWQALWLALGADGLFWTKVLGTMAGAATLVGSVYTGWLLVERLRPVGAGRLPLAGLAAAPLLLSMSPILFTGSVSGLETSLFTALVTWGGCLSLRLLEETPRGEVAMAAGGLLGLAIWTRPEGIAWLAGFAVAVGVARLARRQSLRPLLLMGAVGLGFFLILTIWRLAIFGYPVPNTYYAKMGQPALHRLRGGWGYLTDFLFANGGLWLLGAAFLGLLGSGAVRRRAVGITALAAAAGVLLAWYEGGDWIPHLRLISPVMGLLAGGAAAGLVLAASRLPRAGVFLAVLLPLAGWSVYTRAARPELLRANAEIQTRVFGWNDAHKPLGQWLGEWNTDRLAAGEPNLVVAIEDIGLVGWHGGTEIIDLAGLADPYWAHLHYASPGISYPADHLLKERRPDVVVIVSQSGGRRPTLRVDWDTNRAIYEHPDFAGTFSEIAMFTHKDFPEDGLFLHVFVRNDLVSEAPPVDPPAPRAVGW